MTLAAVFVVSLMLGGRVDPKPIPAEAWQYVSQTSVSRTWVSFALDAPDGYIWQRGARIALQMKDGSIEIAREQYAITPSAERVRLGTQPVVLLYADIERRQFRHEGVRSMIWAAFRPNLSIDSVKTVGFGREM